MENNSMVMSMVYLLFGLVWLLNFEILTSASKQESFIDQIYNKGFINLLLWPVGMLWTCVVIAGKHSKDKTAEILNDVA